MNYQTAYGIVRRFPFAAPAAASLIEAQIAADMAEDVMAEQRKRGKTPGALPVMPNYFAAEDNRPPRLTDLILCSLREGPPLSSDELASRARCSPSNIRNVCRVLVQMGVISTIHPVRNQSMLYCIMTPHIATNETAPDHQ